MNRALIIACFASAILVAGNGYGQEEKAAPVEKKDSYKIFKSRSSQAGTAQLLNEANALKSQRPAEALDKVKEALGMSLAQGDELSEGKCYVLLGEINESIAEWTLALENYLHAYQKLGGAYSASAEYRRTLRGLGNTYLRLGQPDKALVYFQEALNMKLSEDERNDRLLDISEVYYQMGRYEEALNVLDQVKVSRKAAAPSFSNQRAKIYARTNELDKTRELYQSSLNTLRNNKRVEPEEEQSLQQTKEEIVDVLREQNLYDDEIALRNQSIEYNLESKNLAEVTKDKVAIGHTLAAKGENSAALREMEEAARIADTLDNPKAQADAFLALAGQYEKNGRAPEAIGAYKKYSEAITKADALNENELLEKSTLIKKQRDIEELTKNISIGRQEETIQQATVFRQQLVIYGLLFIILITGTTSYFIYKNARASKKANQLLALKSLRSQMNPHFIFNALNSVNHFIAQQDERTANRFLSEFSQLMRLVLENSQQDFIPLHREQEILALYLKLEHYRFRDKFDYEISIDRDLNTEAIAVPPMLIQPYIENAVWHGLRYKETKGRLSLHFRKEREHLLVEITDDGIGRRRSAELKTENQKKHNSTGLKNIRERLGIINNVYRANYRVDIEDLAENAGTRVRLWLPVNKQTNGV